MTLEIATVAVISASFPALALLLSKLLSRAIRFPNKPAISSSYECGFAENNDNFKYINDADIIALSIVLELVVVLLFVICVFNMKFQLPYGKIFARILAGILLILIISSYKYLANKSKSRIKQTCDKTV